MDRGSRTGIGTSLTTGTMIDRQCYIPHWTIATACAPRVNKTTRIECMCTDCFSGLYLSPDSQGEWSRLFPEVKGPKPTVTLGWE